MDIPLRNFVRHRAGHRCEYCRIHETDSDFLSFHIDHVIAKQHGGTNQPEALCWACAECNWAKGPNLGGVVDGKLYPLFNPRRQDWSRHFRWDRAYLIGKTKSGHATVRVLKINDPTRVILRENLIAEGRFPPEEKA